MRILGSSIAAAVIAGHLVGLSAGAQSPDAFRPSLSLQADLDAFGADASARKQVGSLPTVGEVRILRPSAEGQLHWPFDWSYVVTLDVTAAYRQNTHGALFFNFLNLTVPVGHLGSLTIGKQREGVSRQMSESRSYQPFMERAPIVLAFLPTRNDGLRLHNTALDDRVGWTFGYFNSWITNDLTFSENGSQVSARVYGSPVFDDDGRRLVHVGLSGRWSEAQKDSLVFKSKPQANGAPTFIDTKEIPTNGATMLGGEIALVRGAWSLISELLGTRVNRDPSGAEFHGWYAELSWFPKGESRIYEPRSGTLGKIDMRGHANAFEVALEFNRADLSDHEIDGGILDRGTLALSWYRERGLRLEINAGLGRLNRDGLIGRTTYFLGRAQWELR